MVRLSWNASDRYAPGPPESLMETDLTGARELIRLLELILQNFRGFGPSHPPIRLRCSPDADFRPQRLR